MALKPKEEIGTEVHTLDQFFRVEAGTGEAILDGVRTTIRAGFAVVVPAGAKSQHHQYRHGSTEALYALCAAESPGWRCPPYPRRRGGRQRTFRRQDDRVGSGRKKEKGTVVLILLIVILVILLGGGGGYYYGRGAGWGGPHYGGGLLGLVLIILLILWLTGNLGGGMRIR
jgi:Cupin domain/Protein of unknown function (DUF3309)